MKKRIIQVILVLCAFSLFPVTASQQPFFEAIEKGILEYMRKEQIPGISLCIIFENENKIFNYGVANQERGLPITDHTLFEIASLTKVFTSTELAFQVQLGKVQLDDPVTLYMPNFVTRGALNQVTLLDLATHSSSLPRTPPPAPFGQWNNPVLILRFLQYWKPEYPIGSRYLYSNLAFALLGYALQNATGQISYQAMIEKNILFPLKMHSTWADVPLEFMQDYAEGYTVEGKRAALLAKNPWPGSGALRSTPSDMMKFLAANLGIEGPKQLIDAMQFAQKGFYKANEKLTLGLAWQRIRMGNDLIIDKNGGVAGFASYIGMIPNKKIGIVILANKAQVKSMLLGRQILKILSNTYSRSSSRILARTNVKFSIESTIKPKC